MDVGRLVVEAFFPPEESDFNWSSDSVDEDNDDDEEEQVWNSRSVSIRLLYDDKVSL